MNSIIAIALILIVFIAYVKMRVDKTNYYIVIGNAEESEKRAGYSARGNTMKLLQNTSIRTFIDEQIAKKDIEQIAKQDEVLAYLTSGMRADHKEEVLRGVGDGAQVIGTIDVNTKGRTKATELIKSVMLCGLTNSSSQEIWKSMFPWMMNNGCS